MRGSRLKAEFFLMKKSEFTNTKYMTPVKGKYYYSTV